MGDSCCNTESRNGIHNGSRREDLSARIHWVSSCCGESLASDLEHTGETVMSDYPDCFESSNVICKHIRANITVYVDLDKRLGPDVTVDSATVDSDEVNDFTLGTPEVIAVDTVIEEQSGCSSVTLLADRAVKFTVEGGVVDDDEVIVTVGFTTSDGQEDYVDCRFIVGGRVSA